MERADDKDAAGCEWCGIDSQSASDPQSQERSATGQPGNHGSMPTPPPSTLNWAGHSKGMHRTGFGVASAIF